MAKSWQVAARASFLTFLLLAGCVTITQPQKESTTTSSSVPAEVRVQLECYGSFKAVLDGTNVTGQFSNPPGSALQQATLTNLAPGRHTLTASADTQTFLFFCGGSSDTVNFCVAAQTSLSTPSKTALAKGDNLSWTKTSDTTVGVVLDAGTLMTRWNLIRLGGIGSTTGLINSTENSCLCMRSMDDNQRTPIGLAICNSNDITQQWQAFQVAPYGTGNYRFQNNGRSISSACLTEGTNNVLIQRDCLDTSDQLWSIRDNTNGQLVSPF